MRTQILSTFELSDTQSLILTIPNRDPRPFTEERWNTASQLYTLPKAEKSLAKHVQNQKTFDHYMREEAESTGSAFRRASLQSIGQIRRPLSSFESYVKDAIDDQTIDTSSLWSMTYLNIKVSPCLIPVKTLVRIR